MEETLPLSGSELELQLLETIPQRLMDSNEGSSMRAFEKTTGTQSFPSQVCYSLFVIYML